MFVIPVAIYLVLCLSVGIWGRSTRIGFWGSFILSVFLSPFLVFVAMILLSPRRERYVQGPR